MLYIGVARRGSLLSAAEREDRPLRTITTGAAALLIAAIVGLLALTGASAQGPSEPPNPEDLRVARNAFIAEADKADADIDEPGDRTDGQIVINGQSGPDTFARALAWLLWQNDRLAKGQRTLPALPDVQAAKDELDEIEANCIEAFVVCEWAQHSPSVRGDATVLVQAVRLSASSWSVRILEVGLGSHDDEVTVGEAVTVELTSNRARVLSGTELTLSNGTPVRVVVDLKLNKRVEFAVLPDSNGDTRFNSADAIARPNQRFAPANARFNRPLLSSPVSIAYTASAWWLEEGSR